MQQRRKGKPQGSPLSPLWSNILLDELDKELERKGWRYVRYADDVSMYAKSKAEARERGRAVSKFLRDTLGLPINREQSGIGRPLNYEFLGHGFAAGYKKGVKGQYQLVGIEESVGEPKAQAEG